MHIVLNVELIRDKLNQSLDIIVVGVRGAGISDIILNVNLVCFNVEFIFKIYFTQLDDVYIILLEWLKYCFPVDIFEINVWIFVNIKIICVFDC